MSTVWGEPYVASVSLTYDGTREGHLKAAVPLLDSLGLKATFFAYPPNLALKLKEWQQIAANGHEIGNAFLYESTDKDGLAPDWPAETFQAEFEEADDLIKSLDPNGSFAYPSVRTIWSKQGLPIVDEVVSKSIVRLNDEVLAPFASRFSAVRTPQDGFNDPAKTNPCHVRSLAADGLDSDSLCMLAQIGISKGAWTVFVFSGLAETPFDAEAHEQFVRWLASRKDAVRIGTFREIALLLPASANVKS